LFDYLKKLKLKFEVLQNVVSKKYAKLDQLTLLKVKFVVACFGVFQEREFSGILVLGGGIVQFLDGNSRWP